MDLTKPRVFFKQLRRYWLQYSHQLSPISIFALLFLLLSTLLFLHSLYDSLLSYPPRNLGATGSSSLFIAIGSAPQNSHLRHAARETWLKWLPEDGSVRYKFFTDAPPSEWRVQRLRTGRIWKELAAETRMYNDIVLQPIPGGYGNKEHNAYGRRAIYQMKWFVNNLNTAFYLRIDDDSFLCMHRLVYELKTCAKEQFFWGRYWCKEGRNRADENFMLFSSDIIQLLSNDEIRGKLLPFDEEVTLGWNFGYWAWILNISIFDDQTRIDAQQGYLTEYMHAKGGFKGIEQFCERFIYAHHVGVEAMKKAFDSATTHLMYDSVKRTSPVETCGNRGGFVANRHSSKLPNVKIERVD